ncbi:cation transporter [Luteitalea sp.]|jgi:Co/Zn/Cd efflux system component|uniref:cation transporter n=1 Tax=Luteitalea sp. TaxID=2004800 RepID=UPI0025B9CEB7|nr:cation transporter [Luteitalea sp.]
MQKSVISIPKMDCAAEERLVRLALEGQHGVAGLRADLSRREVTVLHDAAVDVMERLRALNLGAELVNSGVAPENEPALPETGVTERKALVWVLFINAGMFVAELAGAVIADSSALLADSLDMFADAAVYGIALFGAHRARAAQLRAAHVSGVLQMLLGLGALVEVGRRVFQGSSPESPTMVAIATAALVANVASLWLLSHHRGGGAHMQASWIFTTNDVLANMGVIAAAGVVAITGSSWPDLVVATMIAFVVLSGAIRILRLKA